MLDKVKQSHQKNKIKDEPLSKSFPRSKKIYTKGTIFSSVNVGMRKISLDDSDVRSITTYDTSGLYTDPKYKHNYDNGLKEIRRPWIRKREGLTSSVKTKLSFLKESKVVERFPSVKKISLRKNLIIKSLNFFLQETILLPKKWNIVLFEKMKDEKN